MAIRRICTLPEPVLRQRARRVPAIDRSIRRLIDDMIETVQQAPGVGLSAPQVGVSLRVVILQMPEEEPMVLVNPEMVKRRGERIVTEGCLSIPGYVADIKRSVSVTVKGQDRKGKAIRIKGTELLGQALEHELDHLNGVLYIDRMEDKSQLRKLEPPREAGKAPAAGGAPETPPI